MCGRGRRRRYPMPTHVTARPPRDAHEEHDVRKLTRSAHAPADWILHAKMVACRWDGLRTRQIAADLHCHPQTVRERLHAFNDRGLVGLGMKPGSGHKPGSLRWSAARSWHWSSSLRLASRPMG